MVCVWTKTLDSDKFAAQGKTVSRLENKIMPTDGSRKQAVANADNLRLTHPPGYRSDYGQSNAEEEEEEEEDRYSMFYTQLTANSQLSERNNMYSYHK